jgi:serine/threonine protein kinase
VPKKTTLKNRIRSDDDLFVDFIRALVEIDPLKRVSAAEALEHPFLK